MVSFRTLCLLHDFKRVGGGNFRFGDRSDLCHLRIGDRLSL